MFYRKDKSNYDLIGEDQENNGVINKPRRSTRLSMMVPKNYNENRLSTGVKDEQLKPAPRILGQIGRRKPLINEKNISTSSRTSELHTNLLATKPATFHDLRFGGGSTLVPVEFADDIDKYLRHLERLRSIEKDFLRGKKVDARMRQILVDWLMQVQHRFQLCTESMNLSISLLDRALTKMDVSKDNLQLLGVTCMFIASKFEEIYVPNIQDFVYIAANIFTRKDMLRMEHLILRALDFELGSPYTIQFLRKYRSCLGADNNTHNLAKFIAEVALLDYSLAHILPSKVAAMAVFLAVKVQQLEMPAYMLEAMEIDESELLLLAKKFIPRLQYWTGPEAKLQSLKLRFEKLHSRPAGFQILNVFKDLEPLFEDEAEEASSLN